MKNLTNAQKFNANCKIERLIKNALALNPSCEIERIDNVTVKINGHIIECKNFNL